MLSKHHKEKFDFFPKGHQFNPMNKAAIHHCLDVLPIFRGLGYYDNDDELLTPKFWNIFGLIPLEYLALFEILLWLKYSVGTNTSIIILRNPKSNKYLTILMTVRSD